MERGVWGTDGYKVQNQIMQNFSHRDRFWSSDSSTLSLRFLQYILVTQKKYFKFLSAIKVQQYICLDFRKDRI
ncbi:hypothetical protein VNO80_09748 [Phaseolus coccineus]|uniref:Uncharacterized protein n=1 Tax=Phaseolus coccineus TaxID=3886 RepID=A0AAN9R9U9_PHACN